MAGLIDRLTALFDPEIATALAALAVSAFAFDPAPDGALQLGGEPVLSSGAEWPARPASAAVPADPPVADDPALLSHLKAGLPLSFIASVRLDALDHPDLPGTGRLVFFYDTVAGPFDPGGDSVAVVWDRGNDPARRATPSPLVQAARDWSASRRVQTGAGPDMRDTLLSVGLPEDEVDALIAQIEADLAENPPIPPYAGKPQRFAPRKVASLPSVEDVQFDTLLPPKVRAAIAADDSLRDGYDALRWGVSGLQIMGFATPEHSDPRIDAAMQRLFGKTLETDEDWRRHEAAVISEARDWRLLLQVPFADWLGERSDGTIYFLIHRDDLDARRFDRALAIWQQT